MKLYLFIFYCLFFLILFVWKSYDTWKKTGINPFKFKKTGMAIDFVGKVYKIISLLTLLMVTVNAFGNEIMSYFIPILWLNIIYLKYTGLILLHLAFIWILIAQLNMANEWRIGIDKNDEITLITNGLFRITRNPIFLGVLISFLGLFLVMPNVLTLIILIVGYIIIEIQVRLEEEFLKEKLGHKYVQYANKTKRWIL
ncbi:MAG: isoprenylcysteine carboxylmethyltransferase family protein [Chlorobi bacterium]|nr:isoprenylcysteine carboxylmethyltransferase family protein [Chlorobiota bacterium]